MRLPGWARFCDRCGARVGVVRQAADPLERLNPDEEAEGPLWDDGSGEASASDRQAAQQQPSQLTEPMAPPAPLTGATVLMDATPSGDEPTEGAGRRGRHLSPAEFDEGDPDVAEDPQTAAPVRDEATPGSGPNLPEDGEGQGSVAGDEPSDAAGEPLPEGTASAAPGDGEPPEGSEDGGTPDDQDSDDAPAASDAPEAAAEAEVAAEGDDQARDAEPDPASPFAPATGAVMPLHTLAETATADGRGLGHPNRSRYDEGSSVLPIGVLVAAIAIVCGFLVAFLTLGGRGADNEPQEESVATSERISRAERTQAIALLNGWWKTNRTFDGRTWHVQDGLMETFAADDKLAAQVLVDPASVERMSAGPGGIEGAGYYFRDIGYFLTDKDHDTLHAINQDGSADEDANLLRTDAPASDEDKDQEKEQEFELVDADADEYLLPESATRVYETWELEELSDHELFVARNEIYARHGYVFEVGELSVYFETRSWYYPSFSFNEAEISDIERQNVSAILAIEQARGSQYVQGV